MAEVTIAMRRYHCISAHSRKRTTRQVTWPGIQFVVTDTFDHNLVETNTRNTQSRDGRSCRNGSDGRSRAVRAISCLGDECLSPTFIPLPTRDISAILTYQVSPSDKRSQRRPKNKEARCSKAQGDVGATANHSSERSTRDVLGV